MLQKMFRDNSNYRKPERRYNIVNGLNVYWLDHKANIVQGLCLRRIASHKNLDNFLVVFFQRVEEINQYKVYRQECRSQRIRDQLEMDPHIAHRLQAEHAKELSIFPNCQVEE